MGRSRNGDPRTRMRLALTEQTVGPVGDGTGTTVPIRCVARAARGERMAPLSVNGNLGETHAVGTAHPVHRHRMS